MAERRDCPDEDPTPLEARLQPDSSPPWTGPVRLPGAGEEEPAAPAGDAASGGGDRLPAEVLILLAATFFVAIGFGLVVPVLPQFAASFGVGATLAGIVVSLFAFMRLVAAPASGTLVNKIGERRVYVMGLLIVAASSLATGLAQDYWQLLVMRGLGGIGSVMFSISASAMMVSLSPASMRGRVSALWSGTFVVGNIAGPALGGVLAQFGMRVPFFAYAGTLVIAAAIIGVVLGRRARRRAGEAGVSENRGEPVRLREVRGDSAFWAIMISSVAVGWGSLGVRVAVLPLFVAAAVSPEPWAAGAVIAVTALGNVLALQWAGRASDRLGRRPLILWGLALSAAAIPCFALAPDLPVLMAIAFVAGAGSGMGMPAQQAATADLIGRERPGGAVLSATQMMVDLGAIIGPIVTGLVVDAVGYPLGFASAGVVLAIGLLAWLPARETLQRPSTS